jgi:hypothetical protein
MYRSIATCVCASSVVIIPSLLLLVSLSAYNIQHMTDTLNKDQSIKCLKVCIAGPATDPDIQVCFCCEGNVTTYPWCDPPKNVRNGPILPCDQPHLANECRWYQQHAVRLDKDNLKYEHKYFQVVLGLLSGMLVLDTIAVAVLILSTRRTGYKELN